MEAFLFGRSPSQLFGVYHPPETASPRFEGVVLCYPFGQEYMRAHRAFRQLATALSRKGFHVLRFDYRGTGDSGGDMTEVTAAHWLQDIDCAVQELQDLAGVHRVLLMGLRLGGLLAGMASAGRQDLAGLVLWDPVVAGDDYLAQVKQTVEAAPASRQLSNFVAHDGNLHFNGFMMPTGFQNSLRPLNLLESQPDCPRLLQVVSHETRSFSRLAGAWQQRPGFHYQHVPAEHDWNYVDYVGGILLPQPILTAIASWV